MDRNVFKYYLRISGLNKKDLASLLNLSYGSVNNWGSSTPYPVWLPVFFELYIKAKKFDSIVKILEESKLTKQV
ncbi:hypothetical protein CFT12S00416_05445 [Campylobacter fetus subsp. testudinum]|uniref:hypothetical protein n=1 Tax=Campylobacter fetus TaxID=196 RepID=UPI0008189762|nr:hypothetical protein [Campylobacter fetus]OCR88869.1 hypothetical protein CFT12S00416_05445 [Campylobacter fetus subsp. testudinum]